MTRATPAASQEPKPAALIVRGASAALHYGGYEGPRVNVDPKIALRRSPNRPAEVIVREPLPLPDEAAFWRRISQAATIGVFLIAFGAFLYFAKPLLVPVLAALTVGMTVGPIIGWARNRGV